MINFNDDDNGDLQIVNGNFSIQSGSNDPTAFFNMNLSNNQPNFSNSPSNAPQFTGGFGSTSFFGSQSNNDQITTPNAPQQQTGASGPSGQCNGNCGACVWSFLCKKATSGLSISGGAPKLC